MKPTNINLNITNSKLLSIFLVYLTPLITSILVPYSTMISGSFIIGLNTLSILIQAPLMLVILVGFTENKGINLLIGFSLILLLAFSSFGLAIWGVNETSLNTIFMVGSFSVLVFATTIFIEFLKIGLREKKQLNVSIILSGIIFAFGSYSLLLSLNMINPAKHSNDIWELIEVVTLIASSVIGTTIAIHKFRYFNSSVNSTIQFTQKTDRFSLSVDQTTLRAVR